MNLHNLRSEDLIPGDDRDVIASRLTGGGIYPKAEDIATEANSHLIEPFMDALGLHALLYRLNNSLTLKDDENLLLAASKNVETSEERLTEALFRLFLPGQPFKNQIGVGLLPTSDPTKGHDLWIDKGDINARDAFHDAVLRIQAKLNDFSVAPHIDSLVPLSAANIAGVAGLAGEIGLAFRYSLATLIPFAVTGADYTSHNVNGTLDLFNLQTETGELTTAWLADRSEFLLDVIQENLTDRDIGARADHYRHFFDLGSGRTLLEPASNGNLMRFTFGSQQDDSVSGLGGVDHIYGGLGNDSIQGGGGNDYIEGNGGEDLLLAGGQGDDEIRGGAGNDREIRGDDGSDKLYGEAGQDKLYGGGDRDWLYGGRDHDELFGGDGNDELFGGKSDDLLDGGLGIDTYHLAVGEGVDTIRDHGQNVLRFYDASGVEIRGLSLTAFKTGTNQWTTADGHITFTRNSPLTLTSDVGVQVVFEDWQDGDFGITLRDKPAEQVVDGTVNVDYDNGVDYVVEDSEGHEWNGFGFIGPGGNSRILGELPAIYAGHVTAAAGGYYAVVEAGGGDDVIELHDDLDIIHGGDGNDALVGSAGWGLIDGQGQLHKWNGADILDGGAGNDQLFANGRHEKAEFITASSSDGGEDRFVDWLRGGAGDDELMGDAGKDVLSGGAGSDLLLGGRGDDLLLGDADVLTDNVGWQFAIDHVQSGGSDDYVYRFVTQGYSGPSDPVDGGADQIYAGAGDDFINAGSGNDTVYGEAGADIVFGGAGSDSLVGGDGDDKLFGDASALDPARHGDDYLDGGAGNDSLTGFGGADWLFGGVGDDQRAGR